MADDVQNKVAARLTLDITPAQQQLKLLSDSIKQTLGDSSVTTAAQQVNDRLYLSEKEQEERMRQLRLNGSSQRMIVFIAANQQMENENMAFQQKMYQNEQMFQERMNQLRSRGATSSGSISSGFGSGFLSEATHIAGGIALYHMLGMLAEIPRSALAAQQSMVKLQQVLEMAPSQADIQRYGSLNGMLEQLQQTAGVMAQTYGVDLNTVIDAMSMVGRRFKDVGDIVVATDSALQLFAVDGVPVENAVTSMEAIMAQFGLTTSQARQAMFEITAAAHSFQVTGSDLVDAITRSGSAFKTMKMDTTESIAALATLSQMTAQTGSTVGNAWKSIENTLGTDKAVKAMKELGVQVYDANGNLDDSVTILTNLQKVWPKLSDEAKNHFASVLAGGKYQYGRLEAFLNDYSNQFQRALDTMKKANAKQQEELVATAMESPTKQLQMTNASVQVLANTIQQQLNPTMITFLTEVRQGTGYVNEHWQSIEHWLGTGAKLSEAYIAWKVALAAYNAVLNTTLVTQVRFAAGTATIIGQKMGFVAGMQAMGGAVVGFGASITGALAKMAAFLAVFQIISNAAYRASDPLGAKIGDVQSQIALINKEMSNMSNGGSRASGTLDNFKTVMGDIFYSWDVPRAVKDLQQNPGVVGDRNNLSKLQQTKADLEQQLKSLQGQQQTQMADEIRSSLDQINQIVAEQMKSANGSASASTSSGKGLGDSLLSGRHPSGNHGKRGSSSGNNGSGGVGGLTKSYLDQFTNFSQRDDMALQTYESRISNTSYALDRMNQAFGTANDKLKAHETDTKAASEAVKAYNDDVKALQDNSNALAGENWQLRQSLDGVSKQTKQVDADYKAHKIDAETHKQAIYDLGQEFGRLTRKIEDNDKAIQQNKDAIVQATSEITSTITDMLQQAYQDEQKIQEQALQNIYQPQIDALTKQKDAVDALIQSLQAQWSAQDNVNQLTDLQNQLAGVMADKRFEIVGTDGKLTYTYDTAKAADLEKQIADQQTKIQRDSQLQQLQDQKDALDKQITNLQNAYANAKQQLDDYWTYKLGQDQLKSDADNLILKNGMDGALNIVQSYAGKIISQYQSIQQAAAQAGGALSSTLGGNGVPTSGSLNPYWQNIEKQGHITMYGLTKAQIASKYGVNPTQIQLSTDGGHATIPWSAIAPYAYQQSGVHMLKGGMVPANLGIPGMDSVSAMLSPKEIVVPSWEDLMKGFTKMSGGGTTVNVNGDLSFPNITKPSDAELFIETLTETVGVHRV